MPRTRGSLPMAGLTTLPKIITGRAGVLSGPFLRTLPHTCPAPALPNRDVHSLSAETLAEKAKAPDRTFGQVRGYRSWSRRWTGIEPA